MKDASHGSACLETGPATAHHRDHLFTPLPYRGCTPEAPRRGIARTGPRAVALLAAGCYDRDARDRTSVPAVALELGDGAHFAVPCWASGWACWAHATVALAYDLHYADIRPLMCNGGISRKSLILVAAALARCADHDTGRNARPSNQLLMAATGLSERQVQRGREALRLLGLATEILRGRQRTRAERYASWRCGDRGRGWASVWALHDSPQLAAAVHKMSPHPRRGPVRDKKCRQGVVTTPPGRPHGRRHTGATRRPAPDNPGIRLAAGWRAHPDAPRWCTRHTPAAWSRILARPARHGWTPDDLNVVVSDWLGTGHRIPDNPHKPIGLLGAILAWHANLDARPAALDDAREAAELSAERWSHAESAEHRRAREIGKAALSGSGRAAVREALAAVVERAARRRAQP
jgi:hypothetical protein